MYGVPPRGHLQGQNRDMHDASPAYRHGVPPIKAKRVQFVITMKTHSLAPVE